MKFYKFLVIFFTACYAFFMLALMAEFCKLKRAVPVEDRELHGYVIIKGSKWPVPFRTEKTTIRLPVNNPIDFLMVGSTECDECFITALLKLSICIILIVFMWNFDFLDPFNIKNLKLPRLTGRLIFALIFADSLKSVYTHHWVTDLGDFKYNISYSTGVYIFWLVSVGLILSAYTKAVKNHRELDLTI